MKSIIRLAGCAILLASLTCAQVTTATLAGVVTDPSGGAISGAIVTINQTQTNVSGTRTTGAEGEFAFDFLRIGTYSVTVEAPGFKGHERRGLELATG